MATTGKQSAGCGLQQVELAKSSVDRVIVVPVSDSLDEVTRLLDWYSANLRGPTDRLVLVRLLMPDCPELDDVDDDAHAADVTMAAAVTTKDRRGGSASSSAMSTTSSSESAGGRPPLSVEAQMERQLEASVAQEARLVRRLRQRGLHSFRFIHAFAREFTGCLLTIAVEQGACAVLAPLSAFAADHDLSRTYHMYKAARIGVIHAPDC